MDTLLEALLRASAIDRDTHRPLFFRLRVPADRAALGDLLKHEPRVQVFDELHSQLTELVRTLNPSVIYSKAERDVAAKAHLKNVPAEEYGVWVYYPWSFRLVHLLDETEFALVRTDRNRNKITDAEQAVLSTKRIGVIGLSVGQSICLTLALERSFGELRIADFDTLELSNLNRIRSGTQCMGHLKTVNVAREIAEIDPFLKVTLFNEGLDRDNIERFCTEGGKLDILVDECDSVDVKIFCRQKARELRIPVLMDTSDRGMLDLERFDLEPDRPILHGFIDHLDPNDAAKAKTNEEKIPFVLPIMNVETLSKRMKASMLEIETSTVTWPQLASSVMLGGALGAEYCRRIALGTTTASGRWFLEMEKMTGEDALEEAPMPALRPATALAPLIVEDMARMADRLPDASTEDTHIDGVIAAQLAEAGALAPSAGNNQPWQFLAHGGRLLLFHDIARSASRLDSGRLIPGLGLGACMENIRLKGLQLGLQLTTGLFPLSGEERLVAVFTATGTAQPDPLARSIGIRCTNRKKPAPEPMDTAAMSAMSTVANTVSGCRAHFVHGPEMMARVAQIVGAAERIRFLNPIGHEEFFAHEIRWTAEEAARTGDGLDIETLELKLSDRAGMQVSSDPAAVRLLREWGAGHGFKKFSGDAIRLSSAVALISVDGDSAEHHLCAGQAVQRLWLQATALGYAAQPISAPLFLSHHVRRGGGGFSTTEEEELIQLLAAVRDLFSCGDREPVFILRLGRAGEPSARSLRLPLNEIFHLYEPIPA